MLLGESQKVFTFNGLGIVDLNLYTNVWVWIVLDCDRKYYLSDSKCVVEHFYSHEESWKLNIFSLRETCWLTREIIKNKNA